MRLEKFIYKKKKEIPFHSLLSPFRPAGHSFPAGLAWPASPSSPAARSPSPFPPSSRSILGRPSITPNRCRAQQLTPGPHLSAPSPTPRGSATARSWRCSNRRHDARRGRVLPLPSASLKGSRAPPRAPPAAPAPFSPRPGRNCRTEEPRRPPSSSSASQPSPSRHRLRFSPVVSSPWSPLSPHAFLFEFRGF